MKFNGLVKFLTVVLILISIYQLHFTWVIDYHEKQLLSTATTYVENVYPNLSKDEKDLKVKEKYSRLIDSTKDENITYGLTGKVSYHQAKEQELNLGLDLQGGMNVTLEIGIDELIKNLSNNPKDILLNKALENANNKKYTENQDFLTIFYEEYKKVTNGGNLSKNFTNSSTFQSKVTSNTSNEEILNLIKEETLEAQKRTFSILQTRIDKFGVAQPSINLDVDKSIISVELAGKNLDAERIRRYLQSTANLQFWELYDLETSYDFVLEAQKIIDEYQSGNKSKKDSSLNKNDGNKVFGSISEFIKEESTPSSNQIGVEDESEGTASAKYNSFSEIISQIQYTVNEYAKSNITPAQIPLVFSIPNEKVTDFLNQINNEYVASVLPSNLEFLPEKKDAEKETNYTIFHGIRKQEISENAKLEGESIANAFQDYDERGRPCIRMSMTKSGEKIWADMTTQNVGMPIAISLDDLVYSAPRVNSPILGGNSEISGSFTIEEAQDLSNILKSGKLPAPTKIVLEQLVGPTLGTEAINGGILSFSISFIVILLLMFAYYNTGGAIANISLLLNMLFTIGVLTALGATLTAPGIAGLVLTIGMAVDTNVVIFERIKEELKKGASYVNAIKSGYTKSLSPVLDAHVTTLLTAIILYNFGLGPVKGFATTQILGILLSLLCGILVSRQMSDFLNKRKRHLNYFTGISNSIFQSPKFKFIKFRKYAYVASVIILLLCLSTFFVGYDLGVEFKGGRTYIVNFNQEANIEELRTTLKKNLEGDNPIIKTIGNKNQLSITTSYLIEKNSKESDQLVLEKIYRSCNDFLPNKISLASFVHYNLTGSQKVLPTISEDLKNGAISATLLSIFLIFIYILIRFRKFQYSLGTIVAIFHDVFVILIVFSFFKKIVPFPLEIDQHFIAAILTVIGFSINDTVIVFDRIREYSKLEKGSSQAEIIDNAINSTLSRTIMTSFTVFLTILILFIFGGEVTRGFAFAMLIGIVTGTYSSIFVAAPILVDFKTRKQKEK